jgi:hypothetical protein
VILKKKNYKYQDVALYPLKGALKCSCCKYLMTSSPSRGHSGLVYYYECRNKNCRKLRINIKNAHEQFEKLLVKIRPSNRVIKLFQSRVFAEWDKVINASLDEGDRLEKRLQYLKKELISVRKAKDDEVYTVNEAKEQADKIRQEIAITEIERSEIKIEQYNGEIVRQFISQFLQNLPLLWTSLDLPMRQAFLQKEFEGSLMCTEDRKIRTFKLSPSFEKIEAIATKKGKYVNVFEQIRTHFKESC